MRTIPMLGRLLWKEVREGWLVVAIAALVPPVAFKVAEGLKPDEKATLQFLGAICCPAAIALWATFKGERLRNESRLPLAHIPANLILERMVALGLPVIMSALAGAWLGRICTIYQYDVTKTDAFTAVGLFALYGAFAFASSCLISAAVSTWTGVAAGIGSIALGVFIMGNLRTDRGFELYVIQACSASILCLVLFLALAHKRRFRFAWAPPIVILASVMIGPVAYDQILPAVHPKPYYGVNVMSRDGAFEVGQASYAGGRSTLFYAGRRTWSQTTKSFGGVTIPVALDDRGRACLIQSLGDHRLRVLEWDGKATRQVANIPGARKLLDRSGRLWSPFGSVSPDRRYVLFITGSLLGKGADCWLVNLRSGEAWIGIPNQNGGLDQATWLGDRVALSARWSQRLRIVDLRTQKTSAMSIPSSDGG